MDQFNYQHFDGIIIEGSNGAIRVEYTEPDQGGTRLLIHFRFFLSGEVEQDSGYSFDEKLKTDSIRWNEVPRRVVCDTIGWIEEQQKSALDNKNLIDALNRFEAVIKQNAQPDP
jgi:hypothetical protein